MRGLRRVSGCLDPHPTPENHKAVGFLHYTGPDPLENQNATKQAFNVGPLSTRHRPGLKL